MKKAFLSQALLSLSEDIRKIKLVCGWCKSHIEIFSDYIDLEYRTSDTIRRIHDSFADEWRMFASNDDLYLVFTYYYESEYEEK